MLNEFKQFLLRGNVVDLAVGVVIGAAFGKITTSLVESVLTPLIGVFTQVPDFSRLSFAIRGSEFMIGDFFNAIVAFLLVAVAIFFFVVKPMNVLVTRSRSHKEVPADPTTKKCTECLSAIPLEAKRCAFCGQAVIPIS